MKHPKKSQRRILPGVSILALAMFFSIAGACEIDATPVQETRTSLQVVEQSSDAALRYQSQAVAYRDAGEHQACAETFARSARASSSYDTGERWYEASRCAARAGDYRQSIFNLQAAASGGFNDLTQVLAEPLFRPLHSGSRWLLVVDVIAENEKSSPRESMPLQVVPREETNSAPCALLEIIRERLSLRS